MPKPKGPQNVDLVTKYLAGDKAAIKLVDSALSVVADISFLRNVDPDDLDAADMDYDDCRNDLDQVVDGLKTALRRMRVASPLEAEVAAALADVDK